MSTAAPFPIWGVQQSTIYGCGTCSVDRDAKFRQGKVDAVTCRFDVRPVRMDHVGDCLLVELLPQSAGGQHIHQHLPGCQCWVQRTRQSPFVACQFAPQELEEGATGHRRPVVGPYEPARSYNDDGLFLRSDNVTSHRKCRDYLCNETYYIINSIICILARKLTFRFTSACISFVRSHKLLKNANYRYNKKRSESDERNPTCLNAW